MGIPKCVRLVMTGPISDVLCRANITGQSAGELRLRHCLVSIQRAETARILVGVWADLESGRQLSKHVDPRVGFRIR